MASPIGGKVVLITGASRGLGAAIVEALDKRGARLVLTARNEQDLVSLTEKLDKETLVVPGDLTSFKFRQELIKVVGEEFGVLDVLINNAGVLRDGAFSESEESDYRDLFSINVEAPISLTRLALPLLRESEGVVVNIVSTSATHTNSSSILYSTSKWAMKGFSRLIEKEFRQYGIRVFGFYPGGMKTHLFDGSDRDTRSYMDPLKVAELLVKTLEAPKDVVPSELVVRRLSK